jgi:hypothetical protein
VIIPEKSNACSLGLKISNSYFVWLGAIVILISSVFIGSFFVGTAWGVPFVA